MKSKDTYGVDFFPVRQYLLKADFKILAFKNMNNNNEHINFLQP